MGYFLAQNNKTMKQKDIDRVSKSLASLKLPANARTEPKPTKQDLERKFVMRVSRNGKQIKIEERK